MKEHEKQGVFWTWGQWMYRFRFAVVVFWLLLIIGLSFFALQTLSILNDDGFTPVGSDSHQAQLRLQQDMGVAPSMLELVYTSETLDLTSEEQKQHIFLSLEKLAADADIGEIRYSQAERTDTDTHIQLVEVPMLLETSAAVERYPEIRAQLEPPDGMELYVTGGPVIMHDLQQASKSDIVKAEIIGLPIALVVLLLIFGTVLGAILPLIVGVFSVTITLGIFYFIAGQISLSNFLPNIVTMLGLAVGIDYALFMVSRFREELKKQSNRSNAVAKTCQTAGKSIFFSGIAVLVGLIGMLFIDLNIFTTLSLGGVLVVTLSVLIANSLLLALFGIFGERINRYPVLPKRFRNRDASVRWSKIAHFVMRRPVVLALIIIALMGSLMAPFFGMKLGVSSSDSLPPSYESRYGSDLIEAHYQSNELNPVVISVQTKEELSRQASVDELHDYTMQLAGLSNVKEVVSLFSVLGVDSPEAAGQLLQAEGVRNQLETAGLMKGNATWIQVIPAAHPRSEATDELVREIRSLDPEVDALVTGDTAFRIDVIERVLDGLPVVLLFVMGVTYLILMFAFHSLLLPLKAVIMNALSLGASLGIVVSVFQHGFMAEWIQVTSTGMVDATVPVIIFCVVFGISMDYEVFLISRIAEEYGKTGNNEEATAEGLKMTGSLITGAALILIVVVGTFIFTDILVMKALGLGLTVAILLDATLIRVALVPALMKLLGKANWWAPKWLKKINMTHH